MPCGGCWCRVSWSIGWLAKHVSIPGEDPLEAALEPPVRQAQLCNPYLEPPARASQATVPLINPKQTAE